MTLVTFMIGSTFVLGIVLVLVGCYAMVRGLAKGGGGTVTILGNTISAKTGGTLIFLVGVSFVASGFGWASSQKQAEEEHAKATVAAGEARTYHGFAEQARTELARADAALEVVEQERTQLRATLKAAVTPEKYKEIETGTPWLKGTRTWKPPAELMRPIAAPRGPGG